MSVFIQPVIFAPVLYTVGISQGFDIGIGRKVTQSPQIIQFFCVVNFQNVACKFNNIHFVPPVIAFNFRGLLAPYAILKHTWFILSNAKRKNYQIFDIFILF